MQPGPCPLSRHQRDLFAWGDSPWCKPANTEADYADTLRLVACEGSDALYRSRIGDTAVADMTANGGIVSGDDLERYAIREREPVCGNCRGYDIVSVGPTSAGGVHIIRVLNLLGGYDVAGMGFGSADYVHLVAEALKIAYSDRSE